jgi:hypothetical protein
MNKKSKPSSNKRMQWLLLTAVLLLSLIVGGAAAQEETLPVEPDLPMMQVIEQTTEANAVNTVVRIFPSRDAFVSSNFPNNNYGGWNTMRAGRDTNFGATRTLIQFDFGSIPGGATINSARLFMFQRESIPGTDAPYTFGSRYLNSSWNESTVTWSNFQADWGSIFGQTTVNNVNGWKSFDTTTLVRNWVSGARANFGMMVQGSNENEVRARVFDSRESANRPYIDVDFTQFTDTCPPSAWFTSVLNQFSRDSFTVSWDGSDCGSSGQPPSGLRNFDVQYSTNNSNWINWVMDTQARSATFHGVNGQIYFFRVRAADNVLNLGPWSASISTTVDAQAPGNLNLTVGTIGASSYVYPHFQVNWSATDNLSGVQKYIVQWNDNAGSGWVSAEFPSSQTNEWVNGAVVGRTYSIRMQAVDRVDNVSAFTPTQNVTVISDPTSVVLPFNPSIVPGPTFNVLWQGFTSTTITQFIVKYQVDGGPWQDMGIYPGTQSFAEFDASTLPGWPNIPATIIGFEVAATAQSQPQEPFKGVAEASIVVDPLNTMTNITYMPVVFKH